MKNIKVNGKVYNQVLEHLNKGKKIAAIKALRSDSGSGLKEAKNAIERLMYERTGESFKTHEIHQEAPRIIVGPVIKKLILDFGEGDIEVDLETMQMMTLMQLQKVGLDACGEILDLVDTLKAFANGQKIGVIDGDR
jgi:hypothetical protein